MTDLQFAAAWNAAASAKEAGQLAGLSESGARCRASRLRKQGHTLKRMTGNIRTHEQLCRMSALSTTRFTTWTGHLAGVKSGELRTIKRLCGGVK